jgi:hypothetical protein
MQYRVYFCDAQGHLVLAPKLLVLPLVLSRPKNHIDQQHIALSKLGFFKRCGEFARNRKVSKFCGAFAFSSMLGMNITSKG